MFGKVFASTFTGSMFGAGPVVFSVWLYILSNKDDKGYVEVNPDLLAVIIGKGTTPQQVEEAIEFLMAPDPRSRSKEEDGRRVAREGEFQYRVVNHEKYRAIKHQEDRREQNRQATRRSRERAKQKELLTFADSQPSSAMSAHTDTDTEYPSETRMASGQRAVALFAGGWKALYEETPSIPAIKAAAKGLKVLYDQHGEDVFKAGLDTYFATKNGYVGRCRHDPGHFVRHFDEFSVTR